MSKDNVKQMFGKLEKDAELQKKYAALMQADQKESETKMAEKLIELGKTSGFAFSRDDLIAARAEVMDKTNSNRELSDGDLANVAGGSKRKSDILIATIFTAGIMCAVISIAAEINKGGDCGIGMSTTVKC